MINIFRLGNMKDSKQEEKKAKEAIKKMAEEAERKNQGKVKRVQELQYKDN